MSSHRIKLKLPNGAELEAEGEADFVKQERIEFILQQTPVKDSAGNIISHKEPRVEWSAVVEAKKGVLNLRGKIQGSNTGKEACLVLIMASEIMLSQPKPSSAMLAKWLRSSGYPITRMDRTLQDAITQGELLSSGSRRSRRYELTATGKIKALLLAEQLTTLVTGRK